MPLDLPEFQMYKKSVVTLSTSHGTNPPQTEVAKLRDTLLKRKTLIVITGLDAIMYLV